MKTIKTTKTVKLGSMHARNTTGRATPKGVKAPAVKSKDMKAVNTVKLGVMKGKSW